MNGSSRIDWPPATWNPETRWQRSSAGGGHGNRVQLARPQGHPQSLDGQARRLRLNPEAVGS